MDRQQLASLNDTCVQTRGGRHLDREKLWCGYISDCGVFVRQQRGVTEFGGVWIAGKQRKIVVQELSRQLVVEGAATVEAEGSSWPQTKEGAVAKLPRVVSTVREVMSAAT
eukprot:GHVS01040763.1.p1 GENE.GHVS01040763.1~~GHVS01040763.1.p1  ORF type:complete len:120 (-),score=26.97 GHVS01040763.1:115-447(-)